MTRDRSMWDLSGWHEITCKESDDLRHGQTMSVFSGLTDPSGESGIAVSYTEWGKSDPDRAILREYNWPDERPCEHWVPDAGEESREPEEEDD